MLLKIDHRESLLIPSLETACSKIEGVMLCVENMDLGDAGIYDDDGTELVLFERKTLRDLAASIKDGRYAEQSLRLSAQPLVNHNVVYIIEGSIDGYSSHHSNVHYKTLFSAIVSLNYFKGFSVIRTWNILETIDIIMSYVAKIFKTKKANRGGFYKKNVVLTNENIKGEGEEGQQGQEKQFINTVENNDVNYVSVIKRTKKENITVNNILQIMLCQIPGVSNINSEAVVLKYPTMEKLIEACKIGKPAFETLRHKSSNRRLPSNAIDNIITYILGNEPIEINVKLTD